MLANKNAGDTHAGKGINSENQQLAEELHKPIIKKYILPLKTTFGVLI